MLEADIRHCQAPLIQEWKEENLEPFDELIISWNAARPKEGRFLFYVRVKIEDWSPWLLYASWGENNQSSFLNAVDNAPVRVYQDSLEVLNKHKATGFQIKIVTEGLAGLKAIHALHVYTNGSKAQETAIEYEKSIYLKVLGLSQMTLNHIRNKDFCSPASTTAVVRYLSNADVDPLSFAQSSWDSGFDIYGNWVLNVAQASAHLGKKWHCWVERLDGFGQIYQRLQQGTPVIVSVRGPLPGSALPYAKGHLMAVIGFDPSGQKVICMDPAFSNDEETIVIYDISHFCEAWKRRGNISYVFSRNIIQ